MQTGRSKQEVPNRKSQTGNSLPLLSTGPVVWQVDRGCWILLWWHAHAETSCSSSTYSSSPSCTLLRPPRLLVYDKNNNMNMEEKMADEYGNNSGFWGRWQQQLATDQADKRRRSHAEMIEEEHRYAASACLTAWPPCPLYLTAAQAYTWL